MFLHTLRRAATRKSAISPLRPFSRQSTVQVSWHLSQMASTYAGTKSSPLTAGSHAFILPCKHNLGHHVLGYHISGKTSGQPIFYFHGCPSSRLQADDFHKIGEKLNLCVIGVDRPGIGLSTFRPGYTLLDWPQDIQKLAAYLGFSEFRVFGGSGGGPYALACARELPGNVLKGTGILAGLGPPESGVKGLSWERWFGFIVNRWLPRWMLHFVIEKGLGRHARNPDQTQWRRFVIDGMIRKMCSKDQALLDEKETERMISDMRNCLISGSDGYVLDAKTILGPWPFDLRSVKAKVLLWNGTDDTDTPIYMARWMANQLPNGSLREFPGDTHFSIFFCRGEEVLKDLIEM
ncbi:alpha/beta-hydrolase [Lindgomyces ingoldianus]|uniref:Alpha/beta-hydrolase n=1 Tax=Lindgomyces ingoldianus TaxID=673940 RepID=A0ACB6RDB8_9PLEO|nr:alpha/beta-hydrolase [Lindgomyces ingoldianus]KAF2477249.1 alpha/beta-hydrolase [Lindgomyces ingoldianus]